MLCENRAIDPRRAKRSDYTMLVGDMSSLEAAASLQHNVLETFE
jgi:hypothetical protein